LSLENGLLLLDILHSKLVVFLLQTLVFIVETDESDIPVPDVTDSVGGAVRQFLQRSQGVQNPDTNEAGIDVIAALKRNETCMD
jgi:hypothetical protein